MAARILVIVACVWIAGIAYMAGLSWPVFPLDMPAQDPQVRAAYDSAVQSHLLRYGLVAIVPAVVLIGAGWVISRRKRLAT
jgi:hypothetical protein